MKYLIKYTLGCVFLAGLLSLSKASINPCQNIQKLIDEEQKKNKTLREEIIDLENKKSSLQQTKQFIEDKRARKIQEGPWTERHSHIYSVITHSIAVVAGPLFFGVIVNGFYFFTKK
jgi:hypothetical protein